MSKLAQLDPRFVEPEASSRSYAATIILGSEEISVADLDEAAREIASSVRGVRVEKSFLPGGFGLVVRPLDSIVSHLDMDALIGFVNPEFTRQATATAQVIRENGRRVGVLVTLSLGAGAGAMPTASQIKQRVTGVARANVSNKTSTSAVKFSLQDYSPDADIDGIASNVAAMFGAYLTTNVTVIDQQPDNDLLSVYDEEEPAAATQE